jgi:hypothetical protein
MPKTGFKKKSGSYYRPYQWPLERLIEGTNRYLALLSASFSNTCPLSIDLFKTNIRCRRRKIKNMIHHESSFSCKKTTAVKINFGAIWVSLYHLILMIMKSLRSPFEIDKLKSTQLGSYVDTDVDLSIVFCQYAVAGMDISDDAIPAYSSLIIKVHDY